MASMAEDIFGSGGGLPVPVNRAVAAADLLEKLAVRAGPDERLGSKDELRAVCSVSVGTFNEALKIAETRGVVTLRRGPGGGIFAARQSPLVKLGNRVLALEGEDNIVDAALRMRNALDPLTIEDALLHSSPADIAVMREEIERMKESMVHGDVRAFLRGNWRFQASVAKVSPNALLRTVFLSLLEILEQYAVALRSENRQPTEDMLNDRLSLYVRMADALEAGDRRSAMQVLTEHNAGSAQPASSEIDESATSA